MSNFLPTSKVKKAENIKFQAPPTPYKSITTPGADHAWQNMKNGNTLAFFSECGATEDSSLESIENENLSALSNQLRIESKNVNYNDREALESTTEGQVDGVSVRIALVVFKKNGCNFTMSYVGRKKYFESDLQVFQLFKERFVVP